jgi:uncharacterized protein YwqG
MDIIKKITQAGYTKEAEALKKWAKNSVVIKAKASDEKKFKLGESKIGGLPHLPKDFVWPTFNDASLAFIAQFNLSEIAKFDTENLLPKIGMLYFFYEGGNTWGFDPKDKGAIKVVYYDGNLSSLTETLLPDDLDNPKEYESLRFLPCKLSFKSETDYPFEVDAFYEEVSRFSTQQIDEPLSEFIEELTVDPFDEVNKLFGYPNIIQSDFFEEVEFVTNGLYCGDSTGYNDPKAKKLEQNINDWILLFQISSIDAANMMWGDGGKVYFAIKKEDLKNKDFDKVWFVLQCG